MTTYSSVEAFYAADPRRLASGEADFGIWWLDETLWPYWRVSYVHATGEVYAAQHGGPGPGIVEVLGVVPPDEEHIGPRYDQFKRYYRTLARILEGWADHLGQRGSLAWVRERLAPYRREQKMERYTPGMRENPYDITTEANGQARLWVNEGQGSGPIQLDTSRFLYLGDTWTRWELHSTYFSRQEAEEARLGLEHDMEGPT